MGKMVATPKKKVIATTLGGSGNLSLLQTQIKIMIIGIKANEENRICGEKDPNKFRII